MTIVFVSVLIVRKQEWEQMIAVIALKLDQLTVNFKDQTCHLNNIRCGHNYRLVVTC